MLSNDIDVEIRGPDLGTLAYNVSFRKIEARKEWMTRSGWTLEVPTFTRDGTATVDGQMLQVAGAGIIIRDRKTRQIVFSGPGNLTAGGTQSAATRIIGEQDSIPIDVIEGVGVSDLTLLDERIIVPVEGGVDRRSGLAGIVVHEYVANQIGTGALASRQNPLVLMLPPEPVGSHISAEAGFQPLLPFVKGLCERGGVTVDVRQNGRLIEVDVRAPRDLSDRIVFSQAHGSIASARLEPSPTGATHMYGVQTDADGNVTDVTLAGVDPPPVRRIETVVNKSGGDLQTDTAADLAAVEGKISMSMQPHTPPTGMRFGVDYDVGDLVGIDIINTTTRRPERRVERIYAAEMTWTADAATVKLTIGDREAYGDLATIRSIENNRTR